MDIFGLMFGGTPSQDFKEIVKLHEMLENEKIPHTFTTNLARRLTVLTVR